MSINIKNFASLLLEARKKLTRLGLCLFYLYLYLVVLGYVGIIYGFISIILKYIPHSGYQDTSIGQAIALVIICWLMTKLFLRESYHLIDKETIEPVIQPTETEKENKNPQNNVSNVIPFRKKSPWE
ncbi:MAG: hypothetical protein P4M14_11850 [Gammaproteobacteria bacterium]|nr:hypothetical protein [Gammaproteobacteria bacterium]